jgi:hypothetical protein
MLTLVGVAIFKAIELEVVPVMEGNIGEDTDSLGGVESFLTDTND